MQRYIYWIENKISGLGQWNTYKEAEQAIKDGLKDGTLRDDVKWHVEKYKAVNCPVCGKLTSDLIVEKMGQCLSCDHVAGDVSEDNLADSEVEMEKGELWS
jgi:ribosomal protein L37AE/L43A